MSPGAVFLDDIQIRNAIADAGRSAVGLGSTGAPERRAAYRTWLFPLLDDVRWAQAMASAMYSCGLNALACLRASGVDAPEFSEPYHTHVGAALSWLASIAQRSGAYVPLQSAKQVAAAKELRYGAVLVVDGPVHVIVLTDPEPDAPRPPDAFAVFVTSEGGMPEVSASGEKGMCIHSRKMALRMQGGRIQTGTLHDDGTVTWGRLALYAIDPLYLATKDAA